MRIGLPLQVDQLMQKLDEQLQLLRQATPLLRQRAEQITDKEAAAVRKQLALVLDQQTDFFESNMQAGHSFILSRVALVQKSSIPLCVT